MLAYMQHKTGFVFILATSYCGKIAITIKVCVYYILYAVTIHYYTVQRRIDKLCPAEGILLHVSVKKLWGLISEFIILISYLLIIIFSNSYYELQSVI